MTPQLFLLLAFGGLIIGVAMWLFQDVKYTRENTERFESTEKVVDVLERAQMERRKPLLKGLDGK